MSDIKVTGIDFTPDLLSLAKEQASLAKVDEIFDVVLYICYYTTVTMTKIAIIEDDPVISQMYRMKFEADGFEVKLADNGKRGVALAESFLPDGGGSQKTCS